MFNLPYIGYGAGAYTQANSIIGSQMSFAGTALAAMNSYVGTMVNYATQSISVPIPTAMAAGLDFDFSREAFDDLFSRKPTSPTTEEIAVTLPIAPDVVVPDISGIILSDLWNDIYEKLNDDITNGGYGIETADEIAIWERHKEREILDLAAQTEDLDEMYAGFGYKHPPGALIKAKQKARQTYQNKLATINRDMTIERLKMFVDCRKFALENGVKFGELFVNIAKLKVELYDSEVKGALGEAEIKKSNNLVKIEKYKADIDGYAAEARVLASLYDLASTQQMREIQMQVAVLQANIEVAKAYLTQAVEQAKLRLAGTQTAAEVYKAVCASALGTIHASAQLSGSENIGWSFGKSESTGASYSESV
jgi:hypothetical protein